MKKYYEKFIKLLTSKIILLANNNSHIESKYSINSIYYNFLHLNRIYKLVIDPQINNNLCYCLNIDIVFESSNKYYNLICTFYFDQRIKPRIYFYDLDNIEIKNIQSNKYISNSYYFGYGAFRSDSSDKIISLIEETINKIKTIEIKPRFYVDIDIDFEFIEAFEYNKIKSPYIIFQFRL